MAGTRRKAYEPGHRPKFLVIVDDTPECSRAVRFAARRAGRIGSAVLLLAIAPEAELTPWLGVGDVMRAEAEEEARSLLEDAAAIVRSVAGIEPEALVRTGDKAQEVLKLIEEDEDVALLVLGAGTEASGPGPLVSSLAGQSSGSFPVPLAIVPGHLNDQEIDALA
jgi:nucleotide-binding universal stress UspA family protein